jgi:hypothetical protein
LDFLVSLGADLLLGGGGEGSSDPAAKAGVKAGGTANANVKPAAATHLIADLLIIPPVRMSRSRAKPQHQTSWPGQYSIMPGQWCHEIWRGKRSVVILARAVHDQEFIKMNETYFRASGWVQDSPFNVIA